MVTTTELEWNAEVRPGGTNQTRSTSGALWADGGGTGGPDGDALSAEAPGGNGATRSGGGDAP